MHCIKWNGPNCGSRNFPMKMKSLHHLTWLNKNQFHRNLIIIFSINFYFLQLNPIPTLSTFFPILFICPSFLMFSMDALDHFQIGKQKKLFQFFFAHFYGIELSDLINLSRMNAHLNVIFILNVVVWVYVDSSSGCKH